MIDAWAEVEQIAVPLSGGGLLSGVALAAKTLKPSIRIVGITMERGAAMHRSLEAGKPVMITEEATLADSLGGGIGLDNAHTFQMVRDLVDKTILVTEAEIADAIHHAYWQERELIEGSGSVGIAAIKAGKLQRGLKTMLLISGKNIAPDLHFKIINGEAPDA